MMWILVALMLISVPVYNVYIALVDRVDRCISLKHYDTVMDILINAKRVSYTKIYRDQVLIYSTSGVSIDKEEIEEFQKDYIKLVFRMCGPTIMRDLVNIFGDLESISISLINEFVDRVSEDELSLTTNLPESEEKFGVK